MNELCSYKTEYRVRSDEVTEAPREETVKMLLEELRCGLLSVKDSARMIADAVYRGQTNKDEPVNAMSNEAPLAARLRTAVSITREIDKELEQIKGALW